jgi:hypothetical protein
MLRVSAGCESRTSAMSALNRPSEKGVVDAKLSAQASSCVMHVALLLLGRVVGLVDWEQEWMAELKKA